ncbi:MAG: protein kinase domain-containing protein [Candidatus Acidiferrales bacterium]
MPEAASALSSGERVANYQILGKLGAGGMGVVYEAIDLKLQRTVALKFLPPDLNVSEKEKERFLKEARTASSLDHPHIGVIHGIEETADGRSFIVMAFYDGESLAQKIRRGPLPFRDAVDIAIQIAEGLAEAHSHHIVHRDVKPSNVMISSQGAAKIVDFGLARVIAGHSATQTGGTTGTVSYMSPEQVIGTNVDQRADIWALGIVLAEMLTGQNPFLRDSAPSIIVAILHEPPRPMDGVPVELQKIAYRALSKDVANRYQTCSEMLSDLRETRVHLPESAAPDPFAVTRSLRPAELQKYVEHASNSAWMPVSQHRRKFPWLILVAAALILAAAGLAFVPSVREHFTGNIAASSQKHIAVLPFDNIGDNPTNGPLAEGLMESLAGKLSNLDVGQQSLWVVPSSEVRRRKINDPSDALRELGANLVVKGSIQRDGQDVHLTVNLIDTKNLRQIGSASLEDRAGDLSTLQDEAVAKLARLMHITVTADMLKNTGGSVTPAAYEDYLKALGYMQRYDKPGNLDSAVNALQSAVKTDPRFAVAYAQLGEAFRMKYQLEQNPKWVDEALANSQKAAQLSDSLPGVYVTLARVHASTGKHDLALEEFQHALQLNPRDPEALAGLARTYEQSGRLGEAEENYKRSAALRPDYWSGYNELGWFYYRQSRYADALAQFQHVLELTPDNATAYSNLGAVESDLGKNTEAEAALKKSIELAPSYIAYSNLGAIYYTEKRYADAAAATEKALALNDQDFRVWENLENAYSWLGDEAKAKAAADRVLELLEAQVKVRPRDARVQSDLAVLYARKKLRGKALTGIQAALAMAPDDALVLGDVAEAYEVLGDRREAISHVELALKHGYDLDELKNIPGLVSVLKDPNFHVPGKK